MQALDTPLAIIDQIAPDMTFARFLATCQPKHVRQGTSVLLADVKPIPGNRNPAIAGAVRFRRVDLRPVRFPDKAYRMFIGHDPVTGDWYYR